MTESFGIESSIRSLEEQAKSINNSYTNNTDLIGKGVDKVVGLLGGETVEKIYANQIVDIQKQAKSLLKSLHTEILTEQQKVRLERLKDGKLKDVGIVQMAKNTDLKQAVVNGVYGVKGEITGTFHGLEIMITGIFDLAVFMGKYAGSMLGVHPEYKIKINEQAGYLYDWIQKEGRVGIQDKVFELIEQEMIRISTLPQEEQAEAIGNIAGNIIGMLTGIKAGMTLVSKSGKMAGKVAQAARITEKLAKRAIVNTARMTRVGNLGKQAGYIRIGATVAEKTLNGVAESLIGYGFAKGLSVTWGLIINSTVSVGKKLSAIEKTIMEMEEALKIETNPTQRQTIQEEIQKLREEKVKIQRPDQNLDELKANGILSPGARIQKSESLLGGKIFSEEQKSIILHIHENISKGIFGNNYSDLREMIKLLQKNGFQSDEIRILMENGILGFGMRTTSRTDGISDYAIGKMTRIVLPNERLERGGLYGYSGDPPEYSRGGNPGSPRAAEDEKYRKAIENAIRNMHDLGTNQKPVKLKKPESKQEMKARLVQERKGGKRDPEQILEAAKQNGAVLLREGEKLMRANPGISGEELGKLIRKRASEKGIKMTPVQERILDAQMKRYNTLLSKHTLGIDGVINNNVISFIEEAWNMPDAIKQVFHSLIGPAYLGKDKIDLLFQSAIYLERTGKLSAIADTDLYEALSVLIKFHHHINDFTEIEKNTLARYFKAQQSIDELMDKTIPYLGISIDPISFPGVYVLKYPIEILNGRRNLLLRNQGFNDGGFFDPEKIRGFYTKNQSFVHVADTAGINTIEHEYQHFLNDTFLSPELLSGAIGVPLRNIEKQEIKYGRALNKLPSMQQDIWDSMQDELCSYIERNGIIHNELDAYLDSRLKMKLRNGEIPKENIQEMKGAIQKLDFYFKNPKFPREDLVGIIRTSYSIEDMFGRLRKKYIHLFPDDPYARILQL